jgi:hypothetical protein
MENSSSTKHRLSPMAKNRNVKKDLGQRQAVAFTPPSAARRWLAPAAIIAMLAAAAIVFYYGVSGKRKSTSPAAGATASSSNSPVAGAPAKDTGAPGEPNKMNVAQAVMVTAELDFGGTPPTIAEALQQIERGYAPDDGAGRTFAILDAYGEPTPDGKKLHISMHVSSEKPGTGMLKFKRMAMCCGARA